MVKNVWQRYSAYVLPHISAFAYHRASAAWAQLRARLTCRKVIAVPTESNTNCSLSPYEQMSKFSTVIEKWYFVRSTMYFNTFSSWDDHAGFLHSFHICLIVLSVAVNKDTITVFRLHGVLFCIIHTLPSYFTHLCQSSLKQNSC